MKRLIIAPFKGEFDWEIMTYNPYLRYIAPNYDEVIAFCTKGKEYLYEFADRCYETKGYNRGIWWTHNGKITKIPAYPGLRRFDYDEVSPTKEVCLDWKHRKFRQLGEYREDLHYDLVFHMRSVRRIGRMYKNWNLKGWGEILDLLGNKYRIAAIGTEAAWFAGTEDKRNIPFKELCDLMRSSTLMVSPSSGPAFLAHLCGLPLITWSSKIKRNVHHHTDKQLHKRLWNPFRTQVTMQDQFRFSPAVRGVQLAIIKNMKKLKELGC